MKLVQLKSKGKEIKSVIYINEKNMACIAYSDFEHYKNLYGDNTVTIFKPNAEQSSKIIDIMNENNKIKSDKFTAEQTEYLLRNLTDVEFEDETVDDFQEISDNPPNDVLACISAEMDDIATGIITKLYNASLKIDMLPEVVREGVYTSAENQRLELENAVAERDLILDFEAKKKELEEMEKKIKVKSTKKTTKKK